MSETLQRRYALLIAADTYADPALDNLCAPQRDLTDLARVLEAPEIGGFTEVTPLVNPNPQEVKQAISHFLRNKRRDDLLVLYFSGHGVIDKADGCFYLAFGETEQEDPSVDGLPADWITQQLDKRKLQRVVLILDCCYSGRFEGTKDATDLDMGALFNTGYGRVVLTASRATERAWDGDTLHEADGASIAHSLFTHYLIKGLETGLGGGHAEPHITVDALYEYAHKQVAATVKVTPQTPNKFAKQEGAPLIIARNARPPQTLPIALNHYFICYAPRDGLHHAERLHDALGAAGLRPWLDGRDTPAGYDREAARENALRECVAVLLVLTPGSAAAPSECACEWQRALRFKKPIAPLRFAPGVDLPLALSERVPLDFTGDFDAALDALRRHLEGLSAPAGQLRELEYRLHDAERDLRHAAHADRARILQDIEALEAEIASLRAVVRDPQAAARAAQARTEAALERERQPERPAGGRATTKFINPPPLIAPVYFQDRHVENRLIAEFLRDPARRLVTVVGRGGVGKTALVCRLLKALESGALPDDLGNLPVSGIIYLSAVGSRQVSFPHLFSDLLRLLPAAQAQPLDALYKDPHLGAAEKLRPVLAALAETAPQPVLALLDNVEDLLDPATHAFRDAEVEAALRALLEAPPHPVKVLLTTRIAPRELLLLRPERQMTVPLDAGLPSPYAEAILRAGDPTGALGLRDASDAALAPACAYTRGFPRALEALTAALNADRAATLTELLSGPPPENVVEALVGEAYSRLDATSQQVLQALAVFGRPVPPAAVDYLLQPTRPGLDSAPVLNRLVNMRFVTKEAGRYYMHPVDRAYAFARIPAEAESSEQLAVSGEPLAVSGEPLAVSRRWTPTDDGRPASPASSFSLPPSSFLLRRAADYFRATRTPRAAWKTLDDLTPQLAEIDLRYAAGDYDNAAQVLTEIDFDYLLLWGHYRLMIEQHARLQGKIRDAWLKQASVGNLGTAYRNIGQVPQAIACYEQALAMAREAKNRQAEGVWLGNLGNRYAELGETRRAIEFHEQALAIDREIGDRRGEGADLGNLGNRYAELGETRRAIAFYEQALAIDREIGDRCGEGTDHVNLAAVLIDDNRYAEAIWHAQEQIRIGEEIGEPAAGSYGYGNLALAHLTAGDLDAARAAAEAARRYDVPTNNANVLALLGVIAARQGDRSAAREAFAAALAHAEHLLALTPENFDALDTKALALAGLGEREAAQAAYQAARALNSDAGIVQRAERLWGMLDL